MTVADFVEMPRPPMIITDSIAEPSRRFFEALCSNVSFVLLLGTKGFGYVRMSFLFSYKEKRGLVTSGMFPLFCYKGKKDLVTSGMFTLFCYKGKRDLVL